MTKTKEKPTKTVRVAEADAAPPAPAELQYLALNLLVDSKTNPRHIYNKEAMETLRRSVEQHGILQPVLVRSRASGGGFEVIAGSRRVAIARELKLKEIPAAVQDLSDDQVIDVQLVENIQRESLHPLEEAEAFGRYRAAGLKSIDIARKVQRSASWVDKRLALNDLIPPLKELFRNGKIGLGAAQEFARIHDQETQKRAFEKIGKRIDEEDIADLREEIVADHLYRISRAPFDTKKENVVPGVCACTDCPFRFGNHADQGAKEIGDACGDPSCYDAKADAEWDRRLDAHLAKGGEVLDDKEVEEVFASQDGLAWGTPYLELSDYANGYSGTKVGELVKQHGIPTYLARSAATKRIYEIVRKADIALVAPKQRASSNPDNALAKARREQKAKLRFFTVAVVDKVREGNLDAEKVDKFLVRVALDSAWSESINEVGKRLGLLNDSTTKKDKDRLKSTLAKWAAECSADDRLALIVELALHRKNQYGDFSVMRESLLDLGIPEKPLEAAYKQHIEAQKKPAPAKAKKAK